MRAPGRTQEPICNPGGTGVSARTSKDSPPIRSRCNLFEPNPLRNLVSLHNRPHVVLQPLRIIVIVAITCFSPAGEQPIETRTLVVREAISPVRLLFAPCLTALFLPCFTALLTRLISPIGGNPPEWRSGRNAVVCIHIEHAFFHADDLASIVCSLVLLPARVLAVKPLLISLGQPRLRQPRQSYSQQKQNPE